LIYLKFEVVSIFYVIFQILIPREVFLSLHTNIVQNDKFPEGLSENQIRSTIVSQGNEKSINNLSENKFINDNNNQNELEDSHSYQEGNISGRQNIENVTIPNNEGPINRLNNDNISGNNENENNIREENRNISNINDLQNELNEDRRGTSIPSNNNPNINNRTRDLVRKIPTIIRRFHKVNQEEKKAERDELGWHSKGVIVEGWENIEDRNWDEEENNLLNKNMKKINKDYENILKEKREFKKSRIITYVQEHINNIKNNVYPVWGENKEDFILENGKKFSGSDSIEDNNNNK
jgi:hypothetical protein